MAPEKTVVSLDQFGCLCSTMFRVSPNHLLWVLDSLVDGEVVNEIVVPDEQKKWAKIALDRMLAITLGSTTGHDATSKTRFQRWLIHLPALPYDAAALEPHIDSQTMQIHHGKHHQAYVTNLNAALDKHPELHDKSLDDLVKNINSVPGRHQGGGPQQRRRPLEPLAVLEADGRRTPAARRPARSPTRSTARSATSRSSRPRSTRPARRASAAAGRG